MADGRDEAVWTNHAHQHRGYAKPHSQYDNNNFIMRTWLEDYLEEGASVLDLGCGSALWKPMFDGYGYIGMDQNAEMIAVAKERWPDHKEFYQMPWDRIPREDGSLDAVFTAAVLQHNKHDQKDKVVREIYRVLKPGGYFLCTENTFRQDNYRTSFKRNEVLTDDLSDGYSFTKGGWEKWMKERGFELVKYSKPSEYIYRKI